MSASSTTSWAHSGWTRTMPSGMLRTERRDVLRLEPLMDRAVALPEDQRRFLEGPFVVARRVRDRGSQTTMSEARPTELEAGVPPEVLVGEEQDLVRPGPVAPRCPQGRVPTRGPPGVGRSAHRAAVSADERLQRRRGVHVGHGHHPIDVGHLGEGLPGLFDRFEVRHVSHGASGVQVGKQHLLVRRR